MVILEQSPNSFRVPNAPKRKLIVGMQDQSVFESLMVSLQMTMF
jgi:hypothetical protein